MSRASSLPAFALVGLFAAGVVTGRLGQAQRARADNGASPSATADGPRATIVIGSKNFAESGLLAEIMAQLIEAETPLTVTRRSNLGGTAMVWRALLSGEIDLYPEYTGTAWTVLLDHDGPSGGALQTFVTVNDELERKHAVQFLRPFGFQNTYALAMQEEVANRLGVRRISDLAAHAATLRIAFSHEFHDRPDGWKGLSRTYALTVQNMIGMEHGLAYQALANEKVDVIDTYTTDGKLLGLPVRLLDDDRAFFPPYDAAPLVRTQTLQRHPQLVHVLSGLAFRLSDAEMRVLNRQVEEQHGDFTAVATAFLRKQALLQNQASTDAQETGIEASTTSRLWPLVGQHVALTGIAMLLAIALALPLGILMSRRRGMAAPILTAAGVLQTIPSLALLAFMIPIPGLGLGARSAIAALFIYALLPILRNTYTGLTGVPAALAEAARGIGLTRRQRLWHVELPLAMPTIMAGIRTAAVISIGVATLAAFVGAGGLGDPIVTGLQLNDTSLILSGAIPVAVLAVGVDLLLGGVQRLLAPEHPES